MIHEFRNSISGHVIDFHLETLIRYRQNRGEDSDIELALKTDWNQFKGGQEQIELADKVTQEAAFRERVGIVDEADTFGDLSEYSTGGGGMAATNVREYIIHPSLDIEAEKARLTKLVRELRIARRQQMDIMDRALHDPQFREEQAYRDAHDTILITIKRIERVSAIIDQLAIWTKSDRSRILMHRADRWLDAGRDIKFPPMPRPINN